MSAPTVATNARLGPRAALSDARIIAKRFLLQLLRSPQLIVFTIVQTLLFLLIFRYVFGGSVRIPGLSYVNYLIPAYLAQIAIYDGFAVAVGLAVDAKSGLIERFRSLPMARSALLTGRAISDLIRQAVLLVIVILVGFLIGFSFNSTVPRVLAALGLAMIFGFALFWVFAWIGISVKDSETAQAVATPFFLFSFLSSGFVEVNKLPSWLQGFSREQPMSQVTNALRNLLEGAPAERLLAHSTGHYVISSLIWSAAIVLVFAPLAIRAYRRL